ncbi:MAG TPA: hypothetical protein VNI02_14350 [Blastocatellia bacterium]|jgi:hypothetical protein|nr:hypothetical protein [Blastocatellia bacterium]
MASAAVAVNKSKRGLVAQGWIINKRDDLVWFIGSVVTSYAFLAANLMLVKFGLSVMIVTWVWALGFDGPHVFGTVSRTYADREERRNRARLLYGSLSLFLLGPSMVLADRLMGADMLGPLFFLFASLWAYYHLVKQHYGFMILYKKKNNDLAEVDNLIDRAFILIGMTYPFVRFLAHSHAAKERLDGMRVSTASGAAWWAEALVFSAFIISLALFVGRQAHRLYLKQPINVPKLLLLAACMPMHWVVLRLLEPVEPASAGTLAAVATLTIYHNIQYHRIIWFHNRNKYARADAARYGAASTISKSVWSYIGFAILFGVVYHVPHYTVVQPDGFWMAFIWGGAFIHYYLDSKIWRVRRDTQLNENLRMAQAKARA